MNYLKLDIDISGLKEMHDISRTQIQDNLSDIIKKFDPFKSQILEYIESDKDNLNIFDFWYNIYTTGFGSSLHTHDQEGTLEYSDYTTITFVYLENNEECLLIANELGEIETIHPKNGETFIIKNNVLHGLEPVKNTVHALMFKLNK